MNEMKRSKITLLALLAVFFGPLILAIELYYSHHDRIPEPLNRGTLLKPMLAISELAISPSLTTKWTLIQIQTKPCEDLCKKSLFKLNQVWLSLGAEQDRVGRALLTNAELQSNVFTDFVQQNYPKLQLLLAPEKNVQSLSRLGSYFIVDPMGKVILAYSETAPPDDMFSDLKRLLTVSQIG